MSGAEVSEGNLRLVFGSNGHRVFEHPANVNAIKHLYEAQRKLLHVLAGLSPVQVKRFRNRWR